MQIISIVPRLPPAIDGVGDYAYLLSKSLARYHGILTQFIACDSSQKNYPKTGDLSPIQLPQRTEDSLSIILDRCTGIDILLLQYVGYGYAKRGCPLWLAGALAKWRQAKASRRLITMFHEVYATADKPWNSQFWTSPIQKKISKDLIKISDAVITSNQLFADRINILSNKHTGEIDILPVFSNLGEYSLPTPLTERQPWLVTFGNSGFRKSIYTDSLDRLTTVCRQLDIREIYDIGHNSSEIVRPIPQIKVNSMGVLSATEISEIFKMARVGFINYPIPYIAKSGIFAAYSSHQICSVFDRLNLGNNLDGVNFNQHYWSAREPGDTIDLNLAQMIASNAYQWYSQHNLEVTTSHIASILNRI